MTETKKEKFLKYKELKCKLCSKTAKISTCKFRCLLGELFEKQKSINLW